MKNEIFAGQGKFTSKSNVIYEGHFQNGLRHGAGNVSTPTFSASGNWFKGKPHRIGLLTGKTNGNFTYMGKFREGLAHGAGTFPEGSKKYVGQWKNDQRHGMGTTKYFNGLTDTSRWKNGKRVLTKKLQRLEDEFTKLKEQNDNRHGI